MKIAGRHFATGERVALTIVEGKIAAIEAQGASVATDPIVAPGFVDIQVNGYGGADFNQRAWGDADEVRFDPHAVVEKLARSGTTRLCPTVTTNARDAMLAALGAIAKAMDDDPALATAIPGFHVEGPYIGSEDGPRGAHPKEHVRDPDWDEFRAFQDATSGRIKICTLAPERPGALAFIEKVAATGVVVAIGHSGADPQTIRDAVSAGARLSTHLGNGSHAVLPRHPNYIWEQLAADTLIASVIADGQHLPAATLKSFVRGKTADRIILTSDAVSLGGLPPGVYAGGRYAVEPSGKVVTAGTPYLAGAGFLLDTCIAFAARATDLTLAEAIRCASERPARLLGIDHQVGRLAVGHDADIVVFSAPEGDGPLRIQQTLRAGKVVYA